MQVMNPLAMAAAVLSTSLATVTGVQVAMDATTLPMIEGAGAVLGPVHAGDDTLIMWSIIKRTKCEGTNARVWNGANGFHMHEPMGQTSLPVTTEARIYNIQTAIPSLAPEGPLALTIEGSYRCPGAAPVKFTLGPVIMEVTQ